jgi:hypothetical protein
MDEQRYTLEEAKLELAREECALYGHDFDVIANAGNIPLAVVCSRCDHPSWKVEGDD